MTVHNYRLVCPNGLHMVNGEVCEKCSGGREYWCILRNCTGSLPKSLGYALRNYVARKLRLFLDNVTVFIALTEFMRGRLAAAGLPADRIVVIPNMASNTAAGLDGRPGEHVGYVGRVSPEKDIPTLLGAARMCPEIPFKAAGSYERMPHLVAEAPRNFQFLGHLDAGRLRQFYAGCRMLVLSSKCFEAFPTVLPEAMSHGKPVVCSRIGGLPEIVDDGVTGLLFDPGNAGELAEKVRYLWGRPELCRKLGEAGREKALREYSPQTHYERLVRAYQKAIELGPGGPAHRPR
jgi:glycosyltransferase involved in cell wall biosynthesis